MLQGLSGKISASRLSSNSIPNLKGESIERIEEVEALLKRGTDLGKLVAYRRVIKLAEKERIAAADIEETARLIEQDIETFK